MEACLNEDSESGIGLVRVKEQGPVRSVVLVMLAMVLGYASTVGPLQYELKVALGINQVDQTAHKFTEFAGFAHIGKFVGYIAHDLILYPVSPLARVYVSMIFMYVGIMVPTVYVFMLSTKRVDIVLIAYSLTGFGFGVFNVTFLSVITPLGTATKGWAILGFPLGFAMINIVCPLCSYFGIPTKYLFSCMLACMPVGLYVFTELPLLNCLFQKKDEATGAAERDGGHGTVAQQSLWQSLMNGKSWMFGMVPQLLGRFFVEYVMQNNPSYYVYNHPSLVPLWSPNSRGEGTVDKHLFFTAFGTAVFLADLVGRRISFMLPLDTLRYNVILLACAVACSLLAFGLMAFDIAALAVVAIFLAFWGNGLMYGAGVKYIDSSVPGENILAAYSAWSVSGGVASILGTQMIDVSRNWYCGEQWYEYVCLDFN